MKMIDTWLRQIKGAMKFSLCSKFIIGCSLTLLATLGTTFYIFTERQEKLIIRQAEPAGHHADCQGKGFRQGDRLRAGGR